MAEDKKLSPLEALDKKHAKEAAEQATKIEAATNDLRAAEDMVREAKRKLAELQREKVTASFAYDAARADLTRAVNTKTA
jgi:hypothetical protein